MDKLWKFFDGKKTYIIAAVAAITGLLEAIGIHVPVWAYNMLAAAGLYTLRAAVK